MRFLADENFNNHILNAVLRNYPETDIIRVQDTDVYQAADPVVLEWAAHANRILLTHDARTMEAFAYERVAAGQPLPGVLVIRSLLPLKQAVDALLLAIGASDPGEWANKVTHLPLR